eukprot:gene2478-3187_t
MFTKKKSEETEIIEIDETYFFNLLQDLGVTKLILDFRSEQAYEESHARASVCIKQPVKDFIEEIHKFDEYFTNPQLKRRGLIYPKLLIYSDNYENVLKIGKYLKKEGKVKKLYLLQDYQKFKEKYPFMITTKNNLSDNTFYPTEILNDFLYLGSYDSAKNKTQLENLKITHILNMASELVYEFDKDDFEYFKCNADDIDGFDLKQFFDPSLKFIKKSEEKEGSRIFVHCNMGISRSTSIH